MPIDEKKELAVAIIDYVFKDKRLLDKFRDNIIQELIEIILFVYSLKLLLYCIALLLFL